MSTQLHKNKRLTRLVGKNPLRTPFPEWKSTATAVAPLILRRIPWRGTSIWVPGMRSTPSSSGVCFSAVYRSLSSVSDRSPRHRGRLAGAVKQRVVGVAV